MILVATLLVGCPGSGDVAPPASDSGLWDGAPYADFGKACTTDAECHGGVCFVFGDGNQVCTFPCTTADQCPSGTQGQKCNKQGRCRY